MIGWLLALIVVACVWRWFRSRRAMRDTTIAANRHEVAGFSQPWHARHGRNDSRFLRQHRGF